MSKYKIKAHIELVKCDETENRIKKSHKEKERLSFSLWPKQFNQERNTPTRMLFFPGIVFQLKRLNLNPSVQCTAGISTI